MALNFTTTAWVYLALAAVFLVLFIALLVYLARSARSAPALERKEPAKPPELAPGESRSLKEILAEEGASAEPYLARFVYDKDGETAGETVGVHDELLILKRPDGFAALNVGDVVLRDNELHVEGDVDWDAAEKAGEAWRESRHDTIEYDAEGNPVE